MSARRAATGSASPGNVTYPKNEHLRQAAEARRRSIASLVETDAPFLSPQKMRGRDNEPANVMTTIAEIARVRGDDVDEIVEATAKNARTAFPGCVDLARLATEESPGSTEQCVRSQDCSEG